MGSSGRDELGLEATRDGPQRAPRSRSRSPLTELLGARTSRPLQAVKSPLE
jgi:hypothetical protein